MKVKREVLPSPASADGITVLRFSCKTPENAETVAGKFLMDLYATPGVAFTNGIHSTPGGTAFAVERDGKRTAIYAADSREALESFVIRNSSLPPSGGSSLPQEAAPLVAFPSFAGQTIHGAKRRIGMDDFALEIVADDTEPILLWEDGRIAATARRVGKGLAIHLGTMFWRGTEDVKGKWKPQDEIVGAFLRDLLAAVGHAPALVETDDRLVLAQPYRSNNGLDLVAVLCDFNEEAKEEPAKTARETTVKLRTGTKPRRIVAYAGVDDCGKHTDLLTPNGVRDDVSRVSGEQIRVSSRSPASPSEMVFDWDEATGTATLRIALPPQEVAILNAECYAPGDALDHWWAESREQWHEIKKPTRDFSKYYKGEWRDPTQDLKEGWSIAALPGGDVDSSTLENIPLDCLQFWGWPEGKGAICTKTFDLAAPSWAGSGATPQPQLVTRHSSLVTHEPRSGVSAATRLVTGSWSGPNCLTPVTIRLNGSNLVVRTTTKYHDFDVTALLKPVGNVLEIEFPDANAPEKFTGMIGSIYLYRREAPEASIAVQPLGDGDHDFFELFAPQEWLGRYRVRLYMEGERDVPKGVRVRDRFMRKHHHNFGRITDIDITGLLRFGETNRVELGAISPAEGSDKTSAKPLSTLRIDLYPDPIPKN